MKHIIILLVCIQITMQLNGMEETILQKLPEEHIALQALDINIIIAANADSLSLDELFFAAAYYARVEDEQQQLLWSEKLVAYLSKNLSWENFKKVAEWCTLAADNENGYNHVSSRKGAAFVALQIYRGLALLEAREALEDTIENFRRQALLAELIGLSDGTPEEYVDKGFLRVEFLDSIEKQNQELAILKQISMLFFNKASGGVAIEQKIDKTPSC